MGVGVQPVRLVSFDQGACHCSTDNELRLLITDLPPLDLSALSGIPALTGDGGGTASANQLLFQVLPSCGKIPPQV